MQIEPVVLSGRHTRLEPLAAAHLDALWDAGNDPDLWRWTWNAVRSRADMERYLADALRQQAEGRALPFATVEAASGRLIGSTRYGNVEAAHRRLEIGWTWVAAPWQRTPVNTEAKFLMLRHAFETLGCQRVELKTDALNERSRRAMLRIGAREEGIFRKHGLTESGRVRDTAWYSIVDDDWPEVRGRLLEMLARPFTPVPLP